MKLEEILDEWKVDSKLDEKSLDRESLKTSELHEKYLRFLCDERNKLRLMKIDMYRLEGELKSYFKGEFNNPEDLKRLGRPAFPLRVLDKNVDGYLFQDTEYLKLKARMSQQEEKVAALEEILNHVNKRGFQIKEANEFNKLQGGFY